MEWWQAASFWRPHMYPGPLLTAEPAPPSLPHPQNSHTTTHHSATPHSHPTAACPTHCTSSAKTILHICFPAVRQELLQPNYAPGRPALEANPSSAGSCLLTRPTLTTLAGLPGQGPSGHLSFTPAPGDCLKAASESQSLRARGIPRLRERETPPGIVPAKPTPLPPISTHFLVHENPVHPLSGPA